MHIRDRAIPFFCSLRMLQEQGDTPIDRNRIEQAIKKTLQNSTYEPLSEYFPFAEGRCGDECVLLDEMIDHAIDSGIVENVGPTHTHYQFRISPLAAGRILEGYYKINGPSFDRTLMRHFVRDVASAERKH